MVKSLLVMTISNGCMRLVTCLTQLGGSCKSGMATMVKLLIFWLMRVVVIMWVRSSKVKGFSLVWEYCDEPIPMMICL